jgi:hypothetical protein
MTLENYPLAIQKTAYRTFSGLNGNDWKILVSYKKKSTDGILYIQDMTRNIYISGLFPHDLDRFLFLFQIRITNQYYILDSHNPDKISITQASNETLTRHFQSKDKAKPKEAVNV